MRVLPFIQLPDEVTPHWPGVTDGFIPYLTDNDSDLVLCRLALPTHSVPEQRRDIPAVMSHISEPPVVPKVVMGALAVDIAQDLLVFSRPAQQDM